MGMIRKLIVLGAATKIFGAFMSRRRNPAGSTTGAGPALAAHSKDTASRAKSGQNRKAASARSDR